MQDNQPFDQQADFNIFHYIGLLRKHFFLTLSLLILGLGLAYLAWLVKPPLYKSSVLIKMNHLSMDVIGFTEKLQWNPYREEYFKTEFRIIKSLPVAEEVARTLGVKYFREQEQEDAQPKNLLDLGTVNEPREKTQKTKEDQAKEITKIASNLIGGVEIKEVKDTNLVRISYTDTNPERAMILANTWVKAYIAHSLNMTYDKNLEAYNFLEEKSNEYRQRIMELYSQLGEQQKNSEDLIVGRAKSAVEEQALVKLNEEIAVANRSFIEKRNNLQALQASTPSQAIEVNQNVAIKDLSSQISRKKLEYEANLSKYKPQLPKMVALNAEIKSMEKRLANEQKKLYNRLIQSISKDVQDRKNELAYLEAQRKKQNQKIVLADLKTKEQNASLDSKIQVLEQNSLVIDKRKEYLELALGLKEIGRTDKVIVEHARLPHSPYAPSLKRHLFSGFIIAAGLAGLLIFLIEITDRKIHNTEVLEMVTVLPTLATIPKVSGFNKGKITKNKVKQKAMATKLRQEIGLLTHLKPNDAFSESYRHLRTNIQLSKTTDNKVLLLSSALSGEGKTVSSLNLAISFAQLEKKTLIIDCDLRRPKLHKIFNLPNAKGLVTSLVKGKSPIDFIQSTKIPHLFLLSSGPLPPNPAELVASQKMREVLTELKANFDFIIIDTAPLLAVTDASILGNIVDSLIFVTKASATSRDEVARALHMLSQNKIKPLGTLFNDYDFTKGKKYYGYKYGYRYKYGYGYGYVPYSYNTPDDPTG